MKNLIFGHTWKEIERAQQGEPLCKEVPLTDYSPDKDVTQPGDIELLKELGIKGLEEKNILAL